MNIYYLVRHAHAEYKADENRPLSRRGHEAALRVAHLLQDYPIDKIYCSPFNRALQTIRPLAEKLDLPITIALELRERRLGRYESGGFKTAVEATWRDFDFAHPCGESNAAAQLRALAFLSRLQQKYQGEHIVLSTHGNLLALLLQAYDKTVDFEFWRSLTMPDVYTLTLPKSSGYDINRVWKTEKTGG